MLIIVIYSYAYSENIEQEQKQISVKDFESTLKSPDWRQRALAVDALAKLGKVSVPYLIQALSDDEPVVRGKAVEALGELGSYAKDAVPQIRNLLNDKSELVQFYSTHALKQIQYPKKISLQSFRILSKEAKIKEILENCSFYNRENLNLAQNILTEIGPTTIPHIIKSLRIGDLPTRNIAIFMLGEFGSAANDAVPELINCLGDRSLFIRGASIKALSSIGDSAVPSLIKVFEFSNDETVNQCAASSLIEIGKPAVPHLIKALKSTDIYTRMASAYVLAEIGTDAENSIPALEKALLDENEDVRQAASYALKKIRRKR